MEQMTLAMELEIGAVMNSVFLLQLREKICEEEQRLFCQHIDVFLGVLRDSDYTDGSDYQTHN